MQHDRARRVRLSIFKNADLLGFSGTTISTACREWLIPWFFESEHSQYHQIQIGIF